MEIDYSSTYRLKYSVEYKNVQKNRWEPQTSNNITLHFYHLLHFIIFYRKIYL